MGVSSMPQLHVVAMAWQKYYSLRSNILDVEPTPRIEIEQPRTPMLHMNSNNPSTGRRLKRHSKVCNKLADL